MGFNPNIRKKYMKTWQTAVVVWHTFAITVILFSILCILFQIKNNQKTLIGLYEEEIYVEVEVSEEAEDFNQIIPQEKTCQKEN